MRKEEKVAQIESLAERVQKAKTLIFADYRGLKVSEVTELRRKLRKDNGSLKVVKNRLMKRVLKEKGMEAVAKYFSGPTAVASSDADPVLPAKIMMEFARAHAHLKVKGGFMDGRELGPNEVDVLAKMPSREVLLSRALASLNAPATNFAGVLAAVPRKLLYALNAIKETKQA
ncbi:MAG: 50S ribosomal protein L10 [bacterium]